MNQNLKYELICNEIPLCVGVVVIGLHAVTTESAKAIVLGLGLALLAGQAALLISWLRGL